MGDVNIESKGQLVDDDESKKQQAEVDRIKAQQAADKVAAQKARDAAKAATTSAEKTTAASASKSTAASASKSTDASSAEKTASSSSSDSVKDELIDAGVAAVAAALGATDKASGSSSKSSSKSSAKSSSKSGSKSGAKSSGASRSKLAVIAVVVLVVIAAVVFFFPKLLGTSDAPTTTTTSADIDAGTPLVTTKIDFSSAILAQSKQEQKLIVLKQDATVKTQLSSALVDLDIFKKTKDIQSFGTGAFTVDLSKVTENSISVDDEAQTVTIAIPHTHLDSITVDHDKTEFGQTDNALLAFGDLKLTAEQNNAVDQSIVGAIREQLVTDEMFAKADEAAQAMVYKVYQPVVAKLSDQYVLQIVFDDATENVDDSGDVYDDVAASSSSQG